MEREFEPPQQSIEFVDRIGDDYELWKEYRRVHGPEAYKWRRIGEEATRQLANLYSFAEEHGIELPGPGPDFT